MHVFAGFWSVADADIPMCVLAAKWHNNSVSFSACNAISCCHILSVSSSTKNCAKSCGGGFASQYSELVENLILGMNIVTYFSSTAASLL